MVALVIGSVAALAMIIVGCTTVTDGTGRVDAAEAPVYRASVSSSIVASEESSAARESERQESLTTQAIHTSCEDLSSSSVDAINAVNVFVGAVNENDPNIQAKVGPAVDALNTSADLVSRGLSDALPPELRDALTAWSDAARNVAGVLDGNRGPDEFNAAALRLNESRESALNLCDRAYR